MNAPPPDGPSPPPKPVVPHIVKVQLPPPDFGVECLITNEDLTIVLRRPADFLRKRFGVGEVIGYFRAELDEDGTLEIGERVFPSRQW